MTDPLQFAAQRRALARRLRACHDEWQRLKPTIYLVAHRYGTDESDRLAGVVESTWDGWETWLTPDGSLTLTAQLEVWGACILEKEAAIAGLKQTIADAGPLPPPLPAN